MSQPTLDELIAKWRERAYSAQKQANIGRYPEGNCAIENTFNECADELEPLARAHQSALEKIALIETALEKYSRSSMGGLPRAVFFTTLRAILAGMGKGKETT